MKPILLVIAALLVENVVAPREKGVCARLTEFCLSRRLAEYWKPTAQVCESVAAPKQQTTPTQQTRRRRPQNRKARQKEEKLRNAEAEREVARSDAETELTGAMTQMSNAGTHTSKITKAVKRLQVAVGAAGAAGVTQKVGGLLEQGEASLKRGVATQELDAEIKKTRSNVGPEQLNRLEKALADTADADVGRALRDAGQKLLDYERKRQRDEKAKIAATKKARSDHLKAAAKGSPNPVPAAASSPKRKYTVQYAGSGDTELHALKPPERGRLQEFIQEVNRGTHPQKACQQVAQKSICKPCAPRNCMLCSLHNAYYVL